MGLDMYLTKRHYVKNWDFMEKEERHEVTIRKNNEIRKDINPEKVNSVIVDVMYWRKANHFHRWFVENVQDGNDNCGEYYVSIDQLAILLEEINKILNDVSAANAILPTQNGFFFGGTDYDEWYFDSLKETKSVLEKELAIPNNDADYYYHSSW